MSTTNPVRLALIGAGRMGSTHARALAAGVGEIELAAVVEPSDAALSALPTLPRRYRGTAELLREGGVDGAIVAVPTRLHVQVVSQLLDARLPVLCEKPCGLTSEEAGGLAAQARAAEVPLHIGYWRRFVPALRELREQIATGVLGEVALVHCAQWDERPPTAAFRDPASSGGIAVDMGVHEFDQLRWLTRQEIVSIGAAASSVTSEPPVEGDPENAAFTLELSEGAIALVSLARRYPPGDLCSVDVLATRGAVRLEFVTPAEGETAFLAALRGQARDFAAAIRGGESSGARAEDAVRALQAAERARAALKSSNQNDAR